jgi:site-specific recombinase XerD
VNDFTVAVPTVIAIQEHRAADGLDRYVPVLLRGGIPYDADLDRFFLDLPLNGVRSPHSLRAYGYDIAVWVRFLDAACGKTVWAATHSDVDAFHRARRRKDAGTRISAASWNRGIAALEKLYQWAVSEGLVASSPFTHRDVWRRANAGGRSRMAARNNAFERCAKRSDVRFVSLEDYRRFRDIGLRGLAPDGIERPGARDRNGLRNALFAELLVATGLRLEEASSLLASELDALQQADSSNHQIWFELPAGLTKGDRGRAIFMPTGLLSRLRAYMTVERAHAVDKFRTRAGWRAMDRPILIGRPVPGARRLVGHDGRTISFDVVTPEERQRLVICHANGEPIEPAALWVTEDGQPVRPNSWEVAFARASRRCAANGFMINVTPHQLRHTFAVHMLAMLIQHQLRGALPAAAGGPAEGYRRLLGDPLQQVQRLLGHASLATTSLYLDHLVTRADTVDAAVEELLALLPSADQP